ncbi:hybrid sensor histidine kinase/response regulator [Vibrio vulnificus]|nr:hybrid sensor histidine kinase/response regulator [Vibrio vulnificus]
MAMVTICPETLPIGWLSITHEGWIEAYNQQAQSCELWLQPLMVGEALTCAHPSRTFHEWVKQLSAQSPPLSIMSARATHWTLSASPRTQGGFDLWLQEAVCDDALRDENARLRRDIERLDFAAQGANLGIWDFNPSTGCIIGNKTWAIQKKLDPDHLFSDDALFSEINNGIEKWSEIVHPDDVAETTDKIQAHLDGETELYHAEFRVRCGDGQWKWILDLGRVFERDQDGVPVHMNGIHVDIDKLKRLQQSLSETKDKAEVANRAKSIFLANMSHELRTPLNAVLGYTQLMKCDQRLTAKHHEYLDIINRSGEHLLSLINDVLDMSKIDAGHSVVERKWFNFREVSEEINDLMQMKAMQKQLTLYCRVEDSVPHFVLGDVVKTRQVLINLLGNAIKFTYRGNVRLNIASEALQNGQHKVTFEVSDTGIGISEENQERVFQPFEQLDSDITQNGTGLGLSISKQFVELMGGQLVLKSELHRGSTFSFSLVMETSEHLVENKPANLPRVLGLKSGSFSPKILIAEDQLDNQTLLATLLQEAGFTVKLARDGEEAVALHKSWSPDFIWMDRRMPKKDGLQATKEIRAASENSQVKIVALTASVFNDEIEEMLASGMDDFARKPFMPQDLFYMMKKHLDLDYDYEQGQDEAENISFDDLDLSFLDDLTNESTQDIVEAIEQGQQQELYYLFEQTIANSEVRTRLNSLVENYQFDELYELFQE